LKVENTCGSRHSATQKQKNPKSTKLEDKFQNPEESTFILGHTQIPLEHNCHDAFVKAVFGFIPILVLENFISILKDFWFC